ncbi:MAG: thiamine-phosphate kinase [Anaerolineae bacterium]
MKIGELGEFGLIDRLSRLLPQQGADVVVGVGDDVAVLRTSQGKYLLVTCDIQLEGSHFLRDSITPHQLGRKAVAINLSDIAAMGGVPRHLLISLGLPQETTVEYVDALYHGFREEATTFGVDIVGGNMARSPEGLIIDIFLLGEVEPEHLLLRSGARPGDRVLVTGRLGEAAAGLALFLDAALECHEVDAQQVKEAFLTPTPRVIEGQVIGRSGLATAMIDISDGLANDLRHICQSSGVGARLWAEGLPISPTTRRVAALVGKDAQEMALHGGEDYELLFTTSPDRADELSAAVTRESGTPVTVIGEIVSQEEGVKLSLAEGDTVPLVPGGWDHFRPAGEGIVPC